MPSCIRSRVRTEIRGEHGKRVGLGTSAIQRRSDMQERGSDPRDTPQPARIIWTPRGAEARTPKHNRLLGVFDEKGQFVIKRGEEFVSVEVPRA